MLRRCACVAIVVLLSAVFSSPAVGQLTVASLIGRVTDQSGAALPGVTVTATSPALQVQQMTDVTNAVGEYRLAPLPVGVYEMTFELAGFQAARRQAIRVTVGFTAKIDIVLSVAAVSETITVSGDAPVVDVTSTAGSQLLTNEILQLSATSRNSVMSLLTMAPGVRSFLDVGGGQMMLENPAARAYGVGGQTGYTLDGIQNYRLGSTFWDYQAFDEVRIQGSGGDAEYATRGVQVQAVVKSGGNEFHGGGLWSGANRHFQGNNLDEKLAAFDITSGDALDSQYDISGDLGGRLIRNKLWFYSAIRKRHSAYDVLNNFQPDGSPGQLINAQRIITNKISFQANPSHRFIFMNMWERGDEQKGLSPLIAYEAREFKTNSRPHTKIEWEGARGGSLIFSLQFGHSRQLGGSPGLNTPQLVGRSDLDTERISGDAVVYAETSYARFYHTTGSVTWYKPNWAYGNHEFKAGFDEGIGTNQYPGMQTKAINYHLQYASGVPDRVAFFNAPVVPDRRLNLLGVYVRDKWTLARRLTLNLGLRYAHENVHVPATCRDAAAGPSAAIFPAACFDKVQLPIWSNVFPRLQAAYDLSGDGKTVLRGAWGRFGYQRDIAIGTRYDPNSIQYAVFQWRDLNRNNNWDPGETNLNPNGADFIEFTAHEFGGLAPRFVPNPNEKQVMYDELSTNFERQLMANFSLRVSGIYSRTTNVLRHLNPFRPYEAYNIPITRPDPGPDGRVGTADDPGTSFTYYEFSPALRGAQFEQFTSINDSRANQSYKTIELSSVKRLSNRWQLVASYSATKKNVPIGAVGLASATGFGTASPTFTIAGDQAGFLNPNVEINTSDKTWEWDGKLSGTYILPAEVAVSANFHHESGDPFARQVRFTGGTTIPSIVLNVTPVGSYRRPNLNLVTFRVEKRFPLPRAHMATVTLNVYNALNANTTTGVQNRSGAQFLWPLSIMPPRLLELGASYKF
jgi:Carboxypeptidase regulatory-like domain